MFTAVTMLFTLFALVTLFTRLMEYRSRVTCEFCKRRVRPKAGEVKNGTPALLVIPPNRWLTENVAPYCPRCSALLVREWLRPGSGPRSSLSGRQSWPR